MCPTLVRLPLTFIRVILVSAEKGTAAERGVKGEIKQGSPPQF